ncbi:MAG TPA: hypothetical protein VMP89_09065 [Solirubrobacteraceae bacterium]|nr:hypothetical protein [Solirubrobacteraceae bacterium]
MIRTSLFSMALVGAGIIALGQGCGAGTGTEDTTSSVMSAEIVACHLDDGTVEHGAQLRACDPQDHKKTTICHIPPGNPSNAHTLCIGNAGVPAHLRNHGDYLGVCHNETPCPPPPAPTGAGGSDQGGGPAGGAPGGGSAGTTGAAGGDSGAAGGAAGAAIIP